MDRRVKKSRVLAWIVILASVLFFMTQPYSAGANRVYGAGVLLLSAILVYRCRHHNLALIIALFLAYSNYSIVMSIYLYPELRPEELYYQITDIRVYGIGVAMLFLFMLTAVLLMPSRKKDDPFVFGRAFVREENYSPLAFCAMAALFLLIILVGYERVDGARGETSALYEYDVIVMILMFYFSGNRRLTKAVCVGCAGIYVLNSLLNGTRIEALACLIVVYLCFMRREIPLWLILTGMIGGVVAFNIIGIFRGSDVSLMEGIRASVRSLKRSKLVFDTCMHAYFPALCMIEQFREFSLASAAHFFTRFCGTVLLGANRVEDGSLIAYVRQFYFHNNGGVVLGFLYVWFSYFGSLILGSLVSGFAALTKKEDKVLALGAALYCAAMVPRWYLYGPWAITRGVLVCTVLMSLTYGVWQLFLRKKVWNFGENLNQER